METIVTRSNTFLTWFIPLLLGFACLFGIQIFLQHNASLREAAQAKRDQKCQGEIDNPPAHFQKSLDCVGWRKRNDAPGTAGG